MRPLFGGMSIFLMFLKKWLEYCLYQNSVVISPLGQWLSTRDDAALQRHFTMPGDMFWML